VKTFDKVHPILALPRVLHVLLLLLKQIVRTHESYSAGTKYLVPYFRRVLEKWDNRRVKQLTIIKLNAGFDYEEILLRGRETSVQLENIFQ
jgi:hypothetical protein